MFEDEILEFIRSVRRGERGGEVALEEALELLNRARIEIENLGWERAEAAEAAEYDYE